MPREAKSDGKATEVWDDLGQLVKIPYFCRWPGCTKSFDSKHERAGHLKGHHYDEEHGTLRGYYVHRRLKEPPCRHCKAAWARYIRERRQHDTKNV